MIGGSPFVRDVCKADYITKNLNPRYPRLFCYYFHMAEDPFVYGFVIPFTKEETQAFAKLLERYDFKKFSKKLFFMQGSDLADRVGVMGKSPAIQFRAKYRSIVVYICAHQCKSA